MVHVRNCLARVSGMSETTSLAHPSGHCKTQSDYKKPSAPRSFSYCQHFQKADASFYIVEQDPFQNNKLLNQEIVTGPPFLSWCYRWPEWKTCGQALFPRWRHATPLYYRLFGFQVCPRYRLHSIDSILNYC